MYLLEITGNECKFKGDQANNVTERQGRAAGRDALFMIRNTFKS